MLQRIVMEWNLNIVVHVAVLLKQRGNELAAILTVI